MPESLTFHLSNTPNGRKILIAAEEMGLSYDLVWLDLDRGDQFRPDFLAISPNAKIPAMVDRGASEGPPLTLFESGAILWHLAAKTGRFGGASPQERAKVMQWLMWQMGGVGPMAGQAEHFLLTAPRKVPDGDHAYGQARYRDEVTRLYTVLDRQLRDLDFVTGPEPTIADFAIYPWVTGYRRYGQDLAGLDRVRAWMVRMAARPAVARGLAIAFQGPDGDFHRKTA